VLPWLGRTLIGTTDRDYEGGLDHVAADADDMRYLLEACNRSFQADLGEADITGAYAGVRPLISTGDPKKSVDISRKAELYETGSGLVTITGGKLTTWRRMAMMAVDRIVEREGREAPCRTDVIPLGQPVAAEALEEVDGVDSESRELLRSRYGHAAHDVLALCRAEPGLARRITPALPDLLAEAVFAARREQAQTIGDVLLRRTRVGLLDARGVAPDADADANADAGDEAGDGGGGARLVARALGSELGWDDQRTTRELERWRDESRAEGLVPV
jgi:glycerol-3-phosphate dehydrogenase